MKHLVACAMAAVAIATSVSPALAGEAKTANLADPATGKALGAS